MGLPALGQNQERPISGKGDEKAELRLRKVIKTRQHQGKSVEGEERVIVPGDSLWRILIQEKGLSEQRFHRYLVLIRSLNPRLRNPDVLRVGAVIFIPIRPDEFPGVEISPSKDKAEVYRVKRGDSIFKILRRQLGFQARKDLRSAFVKVKKLNPHKKNWSRLFAGETIFLPSLQKGKPSAVALVPEAEVIGLDYGLKLPVTENFHLLQRVIGITGNELTREGGEAFALKEGTVRIDRRLFPVMQNPRSGKRVVLDVDEKITPGIRTQLQSEVPEISIIPVKKGSSLHDVADTLFSHLGLQSLPADRPVVLQDGGVGLQVKGEWMVTNAEEGGGKQEIWIISLTDLPGKTPDYLKEYLSLRGMNLQDVLIPSSSPLSLASVPERTEGYGTQTQIETWPSDKRALVDAFLNAYQVDVSAGHWVSLSLREGIRLETKFDRFFKFGGSKYGIFFRLASDEVKRALEKGEGVKPIELDLESLSGRELISRLLKGLGEEVTYQEHRFPAVEGGGKDKLVLTVSGFFVPRRSLFLTDSTIPRDLRRFFFERGLRLVYFQ